jgi:ferritin
MLSKKMEEALNNQVSKEAFASHYYLSMASWCDTNGFRGSAVFLYVNSESERMHMMKLFKYVNDAGGHGLMSAVEEPSHRFKSVANVFELVLEFEQKMTKSINNLVDICLEEKDYSTFNFLQWYVAEQHEEERVLKYILDLMKIAGEGRGIFLVDKEIGKMAEAERKIVEKENPVTSDKFFEK